MKDMLQEINDAFSGCKDMHSVSRFGKHLPGRQAAQFSTLVEPKFSPMVPAGQAAQVSMFLAPCAMDLFLFGEKLKKMVNNWESDMKLFPIFDESIGCQGEAPVLSATTK